MASARAVSPGSDGLLKRAFVVLGMHRSGTSAMTRTLSLLGAQLPRHLMLEQEDNPIGFWESRAVADLNDEILAALDSEWDDVFAFRPKPYLSNFDRAFVGRAVELLEEEFDGAEVIALKDPRLSVLTAFWERVLLQAGYSTTYLVMVRNPLEVAESLRKRDGFAREKSLLLWSSYMVAAEHDTRSLTRVFVAYDDLMRDWREVRRRVEKASGFPFPRDTAAAANEVERFLDAGLRHHESRPQDLYAKADVPDYVKTLYRVFSGACVDVDIDEATVDRVRAELMTVESQLGPLMADLRARARRLGKDLGEATDAQQAEHARAEELDQELASERLKRQSEADGAAEARAELQRQVADLTGTIAEKEALVEHAQAALENERATAAEIGRELEVRLGELKRQLEEARAALAQRDASLAALELNQERQLAEAAELLGQTQAALEDERAAASELRDTLALYEAEQSRVETELNDRVAAMSEQLAESRSAVAHAERALIDKSAEFEATARAADERLCERFDEIASLTRFLAEVESREEQALSDANWLRETASLLLNGSSGGKGRLRRFLPAYFQERRQRKLLERAGLFERSAYLAANRDVAAQRIDPLEHYLKHGIAEHRRRS